MNRLFVWIAAISASCLLLDASETPVVLTPDMPLDPIVPADNARIAQNDQNARDIERDQPEIPARLLDDSHMREELGVNEFTAPSIRKIFETLEGLPPIPEETAIRVRPEKLPLDRCSLALEMGYLMGDGFIIVQCGKMNEVRPISLDLSRYAKAMGAGERVNRHAASLLQNAEDGDLTSFKNNLALTQTDVEQELFSLRDPDMAHLIALGGWIRALDAATASLGKKFSPEQAMAIYQPDVPEYFSEILEGVAPEMRQRRDIAAIRRLLDRLVSEMTLPEGSEPSEESIARIRKTTTELSQAAIGPAKGK